MRRAPGKRSVIRSGFYPTVLVCRNRYGRSLNHVPYAVCYLIHELRTLLIARFLPLHHVLRITLKKRIAQRCAAQLSCKAKVQSCSVPNRCLAFFGRAGHENALLVGCGNANLDSGEFEARLFAFFHPPLGYEMAILAEAKLVATFFLSRQC